MPDRGVVGWILVSAGAAESRESLTVAGGQEPQIRAN